MEQSIKSISSNLGLNLGLILTAITVLTYAINLELIPNLNLVNFLLTITFGVISIKKNKAVLGGLIDFKSAFTSFFITTSIGIGIIALSTIIIFNIIDVDSANILNEKVMQMQKERMIKFGVGEDMILENMEKLKEINNFSISTQIQGGVFYIAFISLIGLVVSAIMKKSNANQI
ncbi:MAG: DUF4199 domain-containing protein [Flavobacteriaceae bacterium]|nr:DUF4199 domain-containing protein [Flavobacteriaceae bacterium]|tara:strand:+ start:2918 stop:3442 length:525 start_codon:yes stop_codon:yes gene_type:complete